MSLWQSSSMTPKQHEISPLKHQGPDHSRYCMKEPGESPADLSFVLGKLWVGFPNTLKVAGNLE